MLTELACDFAVAGTALYALGPTLAEVLPTLHTRLTTRVDLLAIRTDLNRGIVVREASVVIMAGTSQLLRPLRRPQLLADVYRGLRTGGCALVMEAIRSQDSLLGNLFAFHARETGHSGSRDIAEAMQMAGTLDDEYALLRRSGFRSVDIFYKAYGLCGLIAIK